MPARLSLLNDREKDCLRLVYRGMQSSEIARELNRPLDTVERQIKSARAKLGNQRRTTVARMLAEFERVDQSLAGQPLVLPVRRAELSYGVGSRAGIAGEELQEDRAAIPAPPAMLADRTAEMERRIEQIGTQLRIVTIAMIAIGTAVTALLVIPLSERAPVVVPAASHQR